MQHNKYGYVCGTETKIYSDLEKWLKREKAKQKRKIHASSSKKRAAKTL